MSISKLLSFPLKYYWHLLALSFILYLILIMTTFYKVKDSYKTLSIYYSEPATIGKRDITSAIFILSTSFSFENKGDCIDEFFPVFEHYDFITRVMISTLTSSTSFDIIYTIFFQKNPLKLILEGIDKAKNDLRTITANFPLEEADEFCDLMIEWKETNKNMLNEYREIFISISNCYSKKYLILLEIIVSLLIVKLCLLFNNKYYNKFTGDNTTKNN